MRKIEAVGQRPNAPTSQRSSPYMYISQGAVIAAGMMLGFACKVLDTGGVLFGIGAR